MIEAGNDDRGAGGMRHHASAYLLNGNAIDNALGQRL